MANVNVTSSKITGVFSPADISFASSTETTANTEQKFVFTPSAADADMFIIVDVSGATAATGDLSVCFYGGDMEGARGNITAEVENGKAGVFKIDSAALKDASGNITVGLKPATAASKLYTDLKAKVALIESCLTA